MFRFLIRPGCHLCDLARPSVTREVERRHLPLLEVDIGTEGDLLEEFGERVPVLLAPDGVVIAEGRIDPRSLRRSMRRWTASA
ncbi:MAG TPA: glutaredoxin family protein [Acidimicrobiia bacterium]|nr:glutaredoxin family protein [Acidimicrobiia bacterium]